MGLMSKILHKDKDGKDKHHDEDPATSTSSTAGSNTMAQNKSYYTGPQTTDTSSATAPGADTTTTGSHGLGSTNHTAGSHSQFADTTAGPHSSNTGNRVDPRVDSDQSRYGGPNGSHGQSAGGLGSSNTTSGYGSTNAGPHSSNTANAVDPRVDSDQSRYGGPGASHGQFSDTTSGYGSTNAGPHSSNTANAVDPRVDSDRSRYDGPGASHGQFSDTVNSRYENTPGAFPNSGISSKPHVEGNGYGSDRLGGSSSGPGYGAGTSANFSGRDPYPNTTSNSRDPYSSSGGPGPYGTREDYGSTGPASNTIGPHSSNAANIADPRVRPEPEKMRDHRTVGPHQSDMMNKIDPRVDSDPRAHGYTSRDPYDDRNRYDTSNSRHSPTQTGGFVGGPHERLENRGSVPTAGGLPVGDGGNGPYDNMHSGPGSRGADPYDTRGGFTGSHGRDPYESSRGGGLTGSHGREPHDSRSHEPYGAHDRFGAGSSPEYGSGPGSRGGLQGGAGGASDLEIKERELALRHKELDLKEREQQLRRM